MSSVNRQTVSSRLYIRLFGPFEITLGGCPLDPRTPKDLKALAYLILKHRSPVDRAEIAAACWAKDKRGDPIGQSDASRLLSRATSELGRCLQYERWRLEKPTPQSLQFNTEGADLDLLEWETTLAGGVPELERQGTLLRGKTLLADWNDSWVLKARERITGDYLGALKSAALRARDHGDWDTAIRGFELIFDVDPWYKDLVRSWLELLFERRRFAAMGRLYDSFLEQCEQQNRSVDSEVREYYRHLREAANRFKTGEENGWLPTPISGFVARPAERDAVVETIRTARLTTLTGVGGIGKTRLAIAIAEDLRDLFFDRVWFVDLTDVEDPAFVAKQVAQTLLLKEHPEKSHTQVVCEALRAKEALLVLDNCEHLLETCAQFVGQVLEFCPTLKILTTSRAPLRIVGEAVWRVPCLDFPRPEERLLPETMERYSAVRLFFERASGPQTPFKIDMTNTDAVAAICRRLDGIPLAIELAAVQIHLRFLSAHEVANSLEHSLRFLNEGSATSPTRQQTLRAAIDWSYRLLAETERILFERLAVFVGGFTVEAASDICSDTLSSRESVQGTLQALVDKSLVEIRFFQQRRRYHLLQTIQEFALERFEQASPPKERRLDTETTEGVSDAIRRRHLDYYITLIEKASPNLEGTEQVRWFDLLNDEHENMRAALTWALNRGEHQTGLRLAGGMAWFWYTRDHHWEGARWLDAFLAVTLGDLTPWRLKAVHWAGNIAYAQADYVRARACFEEGLKLRKHFGARLSIAVGQASLANVMGPLGDYVGAFALFEASLAIFLDLGDRRNAGLALTNMGIMAYALADYARALALHEEALRLLQEVQDRENIVLATNNLIGARIMSGDLETARVMLPQSLLLCRELGSGHRLVNCLINYVTLARYAGDWQRAVIISAYETALRNRIGYTLSRDAEEKYLQDCALIRDQLSEARFRELTLQGERMTEMDLVDLLRNVWFPLPGLPPPPLLG